MAQIGKIERPAEQGKLVLGISVGAAAAANKVYSRLPALLQNIPGRFD
jgi:hypothetical protein